tara:strand:+ start:1806 stop:2234 length:429 start_codon:yes stop_codon:yes gene_type:complete
MNIVDFPTDIKYKICQYFIELQILDMNNNGWKNIKNELLLFLSNKEEWYEHMALYRTLRWRLSGYIVCNNPILAKKIQIDRSRWRPCTCGANNPPLPYTCKLKGCRCGEKKKLDVNEFTCAGCSKNPRRPWTIPLDLLNITI